MSVDVRGFACCEVDCGRVERGRALVCPTCGGEVVPLEDVVTPRDCPPWCQHQSADERTCHRRQVAADIVAGDLVELELTTEGDASGQPGPLRVEFCSDPPESMSLDDAERMGRMLLVAAERARELTTR